MSTVRREVLIKLVVQANSYVCDELFNTSDGFMGAC